MRRKWIFIAPLAVLGMVLFLFIGALIVAVAALGYKVYDDHRQPKGVQLSIGPAGISVEKK